MKLARKYMSSDDWKQAQKALDKAQKELEAARKETSGTAFRNAESGGNVA